MRERVLKLFRRNPEVVTGQLEYNKYSLLLPVGILLAVVIFFVVVQSFPVYEGRSISWS